jgi:nicotinamidase/pyrazinamidase
MNRFALRETSLLAVDIQQGFTTLCPRELPVPGALEIIPQVNRLLALPWARIDASQDWHPPNHCSFFGQRDNLYPSHCIAGTRGAEFVPGLQSERFQAIWRKGFDQEFEAYAVTAQHPAFIDLLRGSGVRRVMVCGLARNICCFYTARDLCKAGLHVCIAEDATAGIDVPSAGLFQERSKQEGRQIGIGYVSVADILAAAS